MPPTKQLPAPEVHRQPSTATGQETDLRPHVAAFLELSALGWHVAEIRPDRSAPALWRVRIERYDGYASITVMEVDPDEALEELIRYAAIDGTEKPSEPAAAPAERLPDNLTPAATADGLPLPGTPDARPEEMATGSTELRPFGRRRAAITRRH